MSDSSSIAPKIGEPVHLGFSGSRYTGFALAFGYNGYTKTDPFSLVKFG